MMRPVQLNTIINVSSKKTLDEVQKNCDVQFTCVDANDPSGKSSIGAHKSTLGLASDVFERMFYGALAQNDKDSVTQKNHVEIVEIDMKIFKMLLSFIYGLKIEIKNVEDGCEFYYAAHKYNVKNAMEFISNHLSKNLHPEYAIFVYEATLQYEDEEVENAFFELLLEKASEVVKSESFLNARVTTIETIFKVYHLGIRSELELVHALKRYIDAKIEIDKEIAVKLRPAIQLIRFLTLSAGILSKDVKQTSLLSAEEIVNIIACLPPERDLTNMPKGFSTSTKKRGFHRKQEVIRSLSEVFSSKMCCLCIQSANASNHPLWDCPNTNKNWTIQLKLNVRKIYGKYNHVSLIEYTDNDLVSLYKVFKDHGYVLEIE